MGLPKTRYSELSHFHFVDRDNKEMGTLDDIVFSPKTLEPTYLILGSSFFEEFMEEIGVLDNIDELAPIDIVDHIEDDYVILSVSLEELSTTDKKGRLDIEGIKFSELKDCEFNTNDGKIEGDLYDIILNGSETKLLFKLEKVAEQFYQEGFGQKFALSIPISKVSYENQVLNIDINNGDIKDHIKTNVKPRKRGRDLIDWPIS